MPQTATRTSHRTSRQSCPDLWSCASVRVVPGPMGPFEQSKRVRRPCTLPKTRTAEPITQYAPTTPIDGQIIHAIIGVWALVRSLFGICHSRPIGSHDLRGKRLPEPAARAETRERGAGHKRRQGDQATG
jgi:hypothetical protein